MWLGIIISPLGILVTIVLVSPYKGVYLLGVSTLSLVGVVLVLTLLPIFVGLIRWICHIQLFQGLKLLNGRGLNKVNAFLLLSMWCGNKLWRTWERVIQIPMWREFVLIIQGGCAIPTIGFLWSGRWWT
jgi:hypothetical protein